ncbi:membrane protein insertase YidC [Sphingomonas sp. AOB5]|uniref:membrane protein insertase YidC n=1 Tax=Sphingomonas sp. AOB5 TaxID=3034017 RepID=UPI0023F79D2E|nr:membrane protein insertase YidC [Sphingomonas sp. AOB5]MDF7774690.1 membrane protein insertase YidC [Sphingomonas sp. AOB5]
MTEDRRNMITFVVLAALLLIGWPMVTGYLFPAANPPATKIEAGKSVAVPNPAADPTADSPKATRDRNVVLAETRGERVLIDTPMLQGSVNLRGARIDDLQLKKYRETVKKDSPLIRLMSPSGAAGSYFAQFTWVSGDIQAPGGDVLWKASGPKLTPDTPVTLTASNATGQVFKIELSVDRDYMFTIRQTVANNSGKPVTINPYAMVTRAEKSTDLDQWAANVGPMAVYNDVADYMDYSEIETAPQSFDTRGGWAGFTDHYWLTAVIPGKNANVQISQRQSPSKSFQADYVVSNAATATPGADPSKPGNVGGYMLQPNKAQVYTSHFFAGAKDVDLLGAYETNLGIQKLGYAIDWGWFGIIEKPMFYYLDWLFRLVGNFGVAIILLTFTIRGLLFPIAQKQFASMANMRAIQPKMKALQERYKDDKPKQQQEIMKLYKEEKVNPLAGCLPLLLQIPIMFALYKVLLLTIEMRHQPFVLWIKDLSAPDPAMILNLFGYLPFTPPSFLAIGVIPVLLGVSMYYQIKLNPAPMDEMQKQIFAIMPWMLMFLMAPFAVGLQVYWITSNVVTIAQQWWLYKKHPVLSQQAATAAK